MRLIFSSISSIWIPILFLSASIVSDRKISIPLHDLTGILHGNVISRQENGLFFKSGHYTFVHYIDQEECSICQMQAFYQWDDVIDAIGRKDIDYCFIVYPDESISLPGITAVLSESYFSRPVFIDFEGVFWKRNKELFEKGLSHSFVLNAEGVVIIEGNPQHKSSVLRQMKEL